MYNAGAKAKLLGRYHDPQDASVCHQGEAWNHIREFGQTLAYQLDSSIDIQSR